MTGPPGDALLDRYLLGACSEDEKALVEQHFFADDDTFERLREIEEHVIERYLRGELSAEERTQFEQSYGRNPRHRRVLFSQALRTFVSAGAASPLAGERAAERADARRSQGAWLRFGSFAFRLSAAAAGLVVVAGLSTLFWQTMQLRSSLARASEEKRALQQQVTDDRQRLSALEGQAATLTQALEQARAPQARTDEPSRVRPIIASFVLAPGLVRGSREPARVLIPRSPATIRFQLDLEAGVAYRSFKVELRTSQGELVWSQDGLKSRSIADGPAIAFTVPAELVSVGEHEVTLWGLDGPRIEDAGHYYFDAVRR